MVHLEHHSNDFLSMTIVVYDSHYFPFSPLGNSQGMQNIESTCPPNVSLQRTPDSQMSPGFNQQCIIQQQLSPSQQRAPFSPQGGKVFSFSCFLN